MTLKVPRAAPAPEPKPVAAPAAPASDRYIESLAASVADLSEQNQAIVKSMRDMLATKRVFVADIKRDDKGFITQVTMKEV